jgi:hypothetical protein
LFFHQGTLIFLQKVFPDDSSVMDPMLIPFLPGIFFMVWRQSFVKLRALSILCILMTWGCGSNPMEGRYPVSGTVTFDGAPLATGTIQFASLPGAKITAISGSTISNGTYQLPANGALPPGIYAVTISSVPPPPETPDIDPMQAAAQEKPEKDTIPERYNLKSELKFEVKESGPQQANFELKSDS